MKGRYDESILNYRFRESFIGKSILQVKVEIQPCDLQSGAPDGPKYEIFRDASRREASRMLLEWNRFK